MNTILSLEDKIKNSTPNTEERRIYVAQQDIISDLRNQLLVLFSKYKNKK